MLFIIKRIKYILGLVNSYRNNTIVTIMFKLVKKHILYVPIICGAIGGSINGGYEGYQMTKSHSYFENVFMTWNGMFAGFVGGGILGIFWPISITVAGARYYENRPKCVPKCAKP